jgi:hypothetical protein
MADEIIAMLRTMSAADALALLQVSEWQWDEEGWTETAEADWGRTSLAEGAHRDEDPNRDERGPAQMRSGHGQHSPYSVQVMEATIRSNS